MARTNSSTETGAARNGTQAVSSILELRAQRGHILELRAHDGTVEATVEIPTRFSTGAMITLKQEAWTAAELRRLVRVLTRAAEKLDG
jgi:hypothetical protein